MAGVTIKIMDNGTAVEISGLSEETATSLARDVLDSQCLVVHVETMTALEKLAEWDNFHKNEWPGNQLEPQEADLGARDTLAHLAQQAAETLEAHRAEVAAAVDLDADLAARREDQAAAILQGAPPAEYADYAAVPASHEGGYTEPQTAARPGFTFGDRMRSGLERLLKIGVTPADLEAKPPAAADTEHRAMVATFIPTARPYGPRGTLGVDAWTCRVHCPECGDRYVRRISKLNKPIVCRNTACNNPLYVRRAIIPDNPEYDGPYFEAVTNYRPGGGYSG